MCVHREVSYQTLLRQNTYVSPSAQPVQNRTDGRSKKEPHDGKEIMNAATRSILGYQVSDNRGVGPCILAMRMAYNQHKRKAHAVKLSILIWL